MNDAYFKGSDHVQILELLLKYGLIINNLGCNFHKDFYTVEIFKYVIQQLDDIDKEYKLIIQKFTFLEMSILHDKYDVADLLLSHGATPNLDGYKSDAYKTLLLKYGYDCCL